MTTQDDERAAREWLSKVFILGSAIEECRKHRATIMRLLDRPVCPRGEDVPDDVATKIADAFWRNPKNSVTSARAAIDVLHAHLTAPPPVKKVEAWAVIHVDSEHKGVYLTEDAAKRQSYAFPGSRVVKLIEAADD